VIEIIDCEGDERHIGISEWMWVGVIEEYTKYV
jgi:hypothetical protein